MCRNAVNHTRGLRRIDEPTRQYRQPVLVHRIFKRFSYEFPAFQFALYIHFSPLFFQLFSCLFAYHPFFVVHLCFYVGCLGMYPNVCHPVDCFGSERGCWKIRFLVQSEFYQRVLFWCDTLAFLAVVVTRRAFAFRTPDNRMCSLYNVSLGSKFSILPLNKFLVCQHNGVELSSPIN